MFQDRLQARMVTFWYYVKKQTITSHQSHNGLVDTKDYFIRVKLLLSSIGAGGKDGEHLPTHVSGMLCRIKLNLDFETP